MNLRFRERYLFAKAVRLLITSDSKWVKQLAERAARRMADNRKAGGRDFQLARNLCIAVTAMRSRRSLQIALLLIHSNSVSFSIT
jgi:hypothetical protein